MSTSRPTITHSDTSSTDGSSRMSTSLFGSIKRKMVGKKSDGTDKSLSSKDTAAGQSSSSWNPFESSTTSSSSTAAAPQLKPAHDEPPPAYEPVSATRMPPQGRRAEVSPAPSVNAGQEDRYAFLSTFKTTIIVDDSGSMAGGSWREVRDALKAIVPVCTAHDPEGIDVYFLNHNSGAASTDFKPGGGYNNIRDADMVQTIFNSVAPRGATPTGTRLNRILKPYVADLEGNSNNMETVKPINIIVITDGVPTDDPESIIIHHAKKLDRLDAPPHQVGIQFFQVGREPGAKEALRDLDDGLAEQGIRDMVDTVSWDSSSAFSQKTLTADGILKVVLGAVVRRIDRKPAHASAAQGRR